MQQRWCALEYVHLTPSAMVSRVPSSCLTRCITRNTQPPLPSFSDTARAASLRTFASWCRDLPWRRHLFFLHCCRLRLRKRTGARQGERWVAGSEGEDEAAPRQVGLRGATAPARERGRHARVSTNAHASRAALTQTRLSPCPVCAAVHCMTRHAAHHACSSNLMHCTGTGTGTVL